MTEAARNSSESYMRLLGDSENPEKSRINLKIKNYDNNVLVSTDTAGNPDCINTSYNISILGDDHLGQLV